MRQLIKPLVLVPCEGTSLEDLIKLAITIAKGAKTYVDFQHNENRYHIGPVDIFDKDNLDQFRVK